MYIIRKQTNKKKQEAKKVIHNHKQFSICCVRRALQLALGPGYLAPVAVSPRFPFFPRPKLADEFSTAQRFFTSLP